MMRSIWVHPELVHHKPLSVFWQNDEKADKPNLGLRRRRRLGVEVRRRRRGLVVRV